MTDTPVPSVLIRLKAATPPHLRAAHGVELSIPQTAGRNALRKLLQHLLPSTDADIPDFHFLAAGEPLRTTLDKFLTRRNLSSEATLEITYYLPLPSPTLQGSTKASSEWLSSLSTHPTSTDPFILVGSFSGAPAVLHGADTIVSEDSLLSVAHDAPIKAVTWLPDGTRFVSAAQDQTARVWTFDMQNRRAEPVAVFRTDDGGDAAGVTAAAASAMGERQAVALGGEDGTIWIIPHIPVSDVNVQDEKREGDVLDQVAQARKRKTPHVDRLLALRVGCSSTALPVSRVRWRGSGVVSAGWDAVVREWDVERCELCTTMPSGGKPLTDVAVGQGCHVTSAVDGGVRVVDARDGQGVVAACGRRATHNGVVAAVEWLEMERSVVSAGFDGSVRLWDLRAMLAPARAVANVHGGGKALALATGMDEGDERKAIFSGGSDGRVARLTV